MKFRYPNRIRSVILLFTFCTLSYFVFPQQVVINEIMYNPSGQQGEDLYFEYIELFNNDSQDIDLSGWSFTEGVEFVFPEGTLLASGAFLVIAINPDSIMDYYGIQNVIGPYSDSLMNQGEGIELSNALDDVIDYLVYSNGGDWPAEPGGTGPSLELLDPGFDNADPFSWAASTDPYGSPGAVNSVTNPEPSITVITPNGGDNWLQGSEQQITWTSVALEGAVRIELLSADVVVELLEDSTDNTGSWLWQIPDDQPTGSDFKIRISDEADGDPFDDSDLPFTISESTVVTNVVITEIMYHPPDIENDSIEFIEIFNNFNTPIDLDGYYFSQGIEFTFPDVELAPGDYIVVTQNLDHFLTTFGYPAYEWISGDLDDMGETIELKNPEGELADIVPYSNELPWDTLADGYGHSLTLCDQGSDNFFPENWVASAEIGAILPEGDTLYATPYEGCASELPKIVITEIMYNPPENEPDSLEFIELFNRGPEPVNLSGFYFSAGIDFIFPTIMLDSWDYLLLAVDAQAVMNTFGLEAIQWFGGDLDNAGEQIILRDSQSHIIDSLEYSSDTPWDTLAGGYGHSLTLCDPFSDNTLPENWIAAYELAAINQAGDSIFANPGTGCADLSPDADFVADHTSIPEGESVNFTDLSTNGPDTWLWSFPGGTPDMSTDQNPSGILYEQEGNYDVALTVTNMYGEDTETKQGYIHVMFQGDPPVPDFSASDTTILVGTGINFTDLTQNHPDTWQWDFQGGTPALSIEQNPTNIVYNTPGVFDVKLTATNFFGEDSLTKYGYIHVFDTIQYDLVITEIMYNPPESGTDSLEFIEILNFDNLPVNLFGYYFSEGIDYTFPEIILEPGEYVVVAADSAAIFNTFGVNAYQWDVGALSNSGEDIEISDFFGIVQDYVEFDDEEPWPIIADGGGPSLTLCYPQDDNSLPENWKASGEFAAVNAAGDTIWATPGQGCALPPIADFTASTTAINPGNTVDFTDLSAGQPDTWIWIFEGGQPASTNEQNPAGIYYELPGIYSVSLAVYNDYGEDSEIKEAYITVGYAPLAAFTASETIIPAGGTVQFMDQSTGFPLNWSWLFEGGEPGTSTEQNPVVTYMDAGDFDVSLSLSNPFGESFEVKIDYIHVTVGISALSKESPVKIYPNPADKELTISISDYPAEMEIVDMLGEVLVKETITQQNETIHLSSISPGIYFIRVWTENQIFLEPIKLVIK